MNYQLPGCIAKLTGELNSITDVTNEIVSEVPMAFQNTFSKEL